MATISENLQTIKNSTDAIKQAIIDKGGTISGDITTWADAISGISGGGNDNEMIDVYWSVVNNSFKVSFVAPSYGRIIIAYFGDAGGESTSYAWAEEGQNTNLSITAVVGPEAFIEAAMYYGEMSQKVTICNLIKQ
jgi:hypothetical protein